MNYPLISEYIDAIKSAEDNFEELSHLRPVLDASGIPVMSSGNFAVVFKMKSKTDGKLYAVKCFTKEQEGRSESYKQITEELEFTTSDFLIPIKFYEKDLFVDTSQTDNTEFPVLLMDWVEGKTLDKYLRENIHDKYALEMLAYRFSLLASWLIPQPFAHGDLKPDNILVRDNGSLVLVDYDGMFVPSMKGQKARELGSPDFRHPLRTENDFDEHIDDFSIASILLSLKAIAINPLLFDEYGATDRLLLSEKDVQDISQCRLLKDIFPSNEPELNRIVSLFTIALTETKLSHVSFRLLHLNKPNVTSVFDALFEEIEEITKGEFEKTNNPFEVIDEVLSTLVTDIDLAEAWVDEFGARYSKDRKRLLRGPKDYTEYTILLGTKVVCDYAFYDSKNLTLVNIPKSVTQIGYNAFNNCNKTIEIKCHSDHFVFQEGALYTKNKKDIISYISRESLFEIPNKVAHIRKYAFYQCHNISKIIIPNSVIHIEDYAFSWCENLAQINIPNSVTHIGDYAFSWCKKVTQIVIPDSVTHIGDCAFLECNNLIQVNIPHSVTHIGNSAFSFCINLTQINIPDSVTQISQEAFYGCKNLTQIKIPDTVTQIEKKALPIPFFNKLEQIIIPKGSIKKFKGLLSEEYHCLLYEQ